MDYDCLIVDDEEALALSTCDYFNLFDIKTACVGNSSECLDFLGHNSAEVILLDINLPGSSVLR